MPFSSRHLFAAALLSLLLPTLCGAASICFAPHCPGDGRNSWAYEIGVSAITSNHIEDFFIAPSTIEQFHGAAGGNLYTLTATRLLGNLKWEIGGHTFTPQLEVPLTLEIVDENSRSPFLDYNASFTVRWIDFPWNEHVSTSFALGVGLSYSSKVYLADIARHPDEDRSHLLINFPIQLTLALPQHPEHQLMIFISHQSGGHLYQEGGVNSLGIGYRRGF